MLWFLMQSEKIFKRFFVYAITFCQSKDLMKIHNCHKFHQYNIYGCQVNNFQVLGTDSVLILLWRASGPLLPEKQSDFAEFLTSATMQSQKNIVRTIFAKFKFLPKQVIPKVCTSGPTLTPHFPLEKAKIENNKYFLGKHQPSSYPNVVEQRLSLLSPF